MATVPTGNHVLPFVYEPDLTYDETFFMNQTPFVIYTRPIQGPAIDISAPNAHVIFLSYVATTYRLDIHARSAVCLGSLIVEKGPCYLDLETPLIIFSKSLKAEAFFTKNHVLKPISHILSIEERQRICEMFLDAIKQESESNLIEAITDVYIQVSEFNLPSRFATQDVACRFLGITSSDAVVPNLP